MYVFKNTKIKFELIKTVETDVIMQKIWYIKEKDIWLSAGSDFKMYEWNSSLQGIMRSFGTHTDEVTCCINIETPNCIATCSLD